MATKRSQPPTHQPRRLIPWLVKRCDLQRYLGRALTACDRGRVIYVFHAIKGGCALCVLVRFKDFSALLLAAHADLLKGRVRKVSLEMLRK